MPPSLEERIAYLEGKVEEHSRGFEDVRASVGRVDAHVLALDDKVDHIREELGSRIHDLRADHGPRLEGLGSRIDSVDQKVDRFREELVSAIRALDPRFTSLDSRVDTLDAKLDRFRDELDRKMARQFTWLVGIQVSVLVVVIGSLIQ